MLKRFFLNDHTKGFCFWTQKFIRAILPDYIFLSGSGEANDERDSFLFNFCHPFRSELPCCRPCKNEAGYKANITIPVTCEQNATCNSTDNRCCLAPFVEGCSCPDGQYFDGIKCVNMTYECNRPCVSSSSSSTTSSTTR